MTPRPFLLICFPVLALSLACSSGTRDDRPQPSEAPSTQATENAVAANNTAAEPEPAADPQPAEPQPLALGAAIPMADQAMKNVDESNVNLASVAGEKGTLVVFTCNHCPFAQAWEGRITELGNRFQEEGIGVVAINANGTERFPGDAFEPMQQRAEAAGMKFPYVVDATSEVARAFGAEKTPEAFLFDGEGKLVYRGAIDDNSNSADEVEHTYLKDALEALVAGNSIENAEVPAIGCSIKLRPEEAS